MTDSTSRRVSKQPPSADAVNPLREPVYLQPPVQPTQGQVVGRVFGYLGMAVLWLLILGMALFITVGILALGVGDDIGDLPAVKGWNAVIGLVMMVFLGAPVMGFATVFLALWTAGMALSAATLFVRSLNPRYRHEQLSTSRRSRAGEAVGGISTAVTGVSLSLLPVRLTRWAKVVTMIRFNGSVLNLNTLVIGYAWGLFYLFTVVWPRWPASGAGVPVCTAISILLFAVFIGAIWWRRGSYAEVMPEELEGTVYQRSWPNKPVAPAKKGSRKPAAKKSTVSGSGPRTSGG